MTDNPNAKDIITLADRMKRAVIKRDAATLNRIINAYQDMYERLQPAIDALVLKLETEGVLTKGQIQRLAQYKQLNDAIEREMQRFGGFLSTELSTSARASIEYATKDARLLMAALLSSDATVTAGIQMLNPKVVEKLIAFLAPDGALFARLDEILPGAAARVAETIISNVGLGKNPRDIARMITKELGMTLTDSLRTSRTVQLWAYREASRANYIANRDIVSGWMWYATLDEDCCPSCIAMHGQIFPVDEVQDDHYSGHCTMIPCTQLYTPEVEKGEDWFNKQSEEKQASILGKQYYDAYKNGMFNFSDLSRRNENDIYGSMRTTAPLWDLLGAEPPTRTK